MLSFLLSLSRRHQRARHDLIALRSECVALRNEATAAGTARDHFRRQSEIAGLALVEARQALTLAAEPSRAARSVSVDRRRAIIGAIRACEIHAGGHPNAVEIADIVTGQRGWRTAFAGMADASIARIVSDVAREGWILGDGKKPIGYTITITGQAELPASDE